MKHGWVLGLFALFAAGCQREEPVVRQPAPEPPVVNSDPVVTEPKTEKPTEPPKERPRGFNENRVVQLSELETVEVQVGGRKLKMWLMNDDSRRAEGMMFLKESDVPRDKGMLFVFPDEQPRGFWMRNVEFDLDTAFVAADGTIVSTALMKANDETTTESEGPAKYVIEMRPGSFKRLGIKKGVKVKIPESIETYE